jgi:hypothetical protein
MPPQQTNFQTTMDGQNISLADGSTSASGQVSNIQRSSPGSAGVAVAV